MSYLDDDYTDDTKADARSFAYSLSSDSSSAFSETSTSQYSMADSATMTADDQSDAQSGSRIGSAGSSRGSAFRSARLKRRLEGAGWMRRNCFAIVNHSVFSGVILCIIATNTIILALETTNYLSRNYGWYLTMVDQIFLGIYMMETITKLYVYRVDYFFSGWSLFDLAIVLSSIISFILPVILQSSTSFNPKARFNSFVIRLLRVFRALRAIRSLRALRAVAFLKSLQVVVQTILVSIPAISSIVSLAMLVLYIFAVIGRSLYGNIDARFGSLTTTAFWLFSCLTLNNWSDIWHDNKNRAPGIFMYLFIFIILETFVFLNLLVAVICTNLDQSRSRMDALRKKDLKREKREQRQKLQEQQASKSIPDLSEVGKSAEEVAEAQRMAQLFENEMGVDNYYPPNLPHRQKELMGSYLMLLTSLEHNYGFYQKQQKVLDDLAKEMLSLVLVLSLGTLLARAAPAPKVNKVAMVRFPSESQWTSFNIAVEPSSTGADWTLSVFFDETEAAVFGRHQNGSTHISCHGDTATLVSELLVNQPTDTTLVRTASSITVSFRAANKALGTCLIPDSTLAVDNPMLIWDEEDIPLAEHLQGIHVQVDGKPKPRMDEPLTLNSEGSH
ncbi:Cation channel sperm-associated protein 1 [Sorochytrium milnesiophthora]